MSKPYPRHAKSNSETCTCIHLRSLHAAVRRRVCTCVCVCLFQFVCVCLCMFVCTPWRCACVHVLSTCVASTVTARLQQGGFCTPVVTQRSGDRCQNDGVWAKFHKKDRKELCTTATHPVLAPWQHQASLPNTTEVQLRQNAPP